MADYIAVVTCRHEFKVKDPEAFVKAFEKYGTELRLVREKNDSFVIYGYDDMHLWDDEADNSVWLPNFVQEHLAPRQIAVFREIGWTKARYMGGGGIAVIVSDGGLEEYFLHKYVENSLRNLRETFDIPEPIS